MLTPYSSQALSVLLQLLPDLAPLVTIEHDHFEMTQAGPAGWALTVSSAEDEITVYFADHHRHFGWHEGDPTDDATAAAEYIRSLREGNLVLLVWYRGQEMVSCWPIEAKESPVPPTWFQRWLRRKQNYLIKQWAE
jgi:hypothetical protein